MLTIVYGIGVYMYSGTLQKRTPLGPKILSLIAKCPLFRGVCWHAPLSIMANYDGERLCTMKLILLIYRFLALRQELETYRSFIAIVD
jgi:hypothetical protein